MRQPRQERIGDHGAGDGHLERGVRRRRKHLVEAPLRARPPAARRRFRVEEQHFLEQRVVARVEAAAVQHADVAREVAQRIAQISRVGRDARALLEPQVEPVDHDERPLAVRGL